LIGFESHLDLVLLVFPFPFVQDMKSEFQVLGLQEQAPRVFLSGLILFYGHLNEHQDSL
jgi:hypothetical protein